MADFKINHGAPRGNPLVTVLLLIGMAIVIGVSVVLGFFAFLALSGLAMVAAVAVSIRRWWASRRAAATAPVNTDARGNDVIEGEFHVVKRPKNS